MRGVWTLRVGQPRPSPEDMMAVKAATLDEIELWLTVCLEARDVTKPSGRHLFTPWEREFIVSVNKQYDEEHLMGFSRILSLKQRAYLKRMYDLLCADTLERVNAGTAQIPFGDFFIDDEGRHGA